MKLCKNPNQRLCGTAVNKRDSNISFSDICLCYKAFRNSYMGAFRMHHEKVFKYTVFTVSVTRVGVRGCMRTQSSKARVVVGLNVGSP